MQQTLRAAALRRKRPKTHKSFRSARRRGGGRIDTGKFVRYLRIAFKPSHNVKRPWHHERDRMRAYRVDANQIGARLDAPSVCLTARADLQYAVF